jgi:hypothetical protein
MQSKRVRDMVGGYQTSASQRRGGYLPLAEQGCGYRSVLVLAGPRRGQVLVLDRPSTLTTS